MKERIIQCDINNPIDAPHLFVQNAKVDEFNERVHNAALGNKYRIRAQDSVIGANSAELREKILQQIPNDPRKTKQLAWNLCVVFWGFLVYAIFGHAHIRRASCKVLGVFCY